MKKCRAIRTIDGYLHSSCIKCKDKDTAIKTIQAQDMAMFKCDSWECNPRDVEEVEK